MKKQKVEFEKKYEYLIKDGNYYEWKSIDGKPILVLANKKKVEEREKKAKEIASKIKEGLDAMAVITESLMRFTERDLEKLHKLVNSTKRKYKPRTRKEHCVDMKVGGFIIPIID